MSDQDTEDTQNTEAGEAALELDVVSLEEAEEEAAAAREALDPEQQEIEQQLAEQVAEVIQDTDDEPDAVIDDVAEDIAEPVEETPALSPSPVDTAEVAAEPVESVKKPRPRTLARKTSSEDDVMLFDDDDLFTDNDIESTPPAEPEFEEDDDFIVIDDNEMGSNAAANTNEQLASASDIEGLTEIVLDAAGAANEAAHSTNQSIHMLLGSVATINSMAKDLRKTNTWVLGFIISLGVVGLLSGAAMLFVLQSAVKDATAISIAMGTKLVQFERQMDRVKVIETQLLDVADINHQLGQRLEQVMYHLGEVGTEAQQAASVQAAENQIMLGSVNEQIVNSFDDLQATSKAQQAVLTQLQKRISGLDVQMKKIQNQDLVGKMKALIALEQERYFELEQAKLELEQAQFEAQQKADAPPVEDTYITFGAKSE